ncbi:pilus assembly PilX N-terminal domain-containing protein [Tolumonas osonensis]|uniref:Type 4 fimbrial biogenesis protein PilX N-terminal domain-containing protein n=1 Tax=Tolumonas osonensis TaxID=675874 RepID=A0A841GEK2_9GAMM|nr:pilus assembly PilX N-terminal domain-containing protein [Tolumonas osonensis]MBB6055066.1 hypothetical protein [Tolumonas osonensis]
MTNLNKESGFITLTVVLIIVLLITALSLMTGKMLMGEQRSASNQVRYHEAMNAAQAGLDKGIAQLMSDFDNRADLKHQTAVPYYQVSFGNVSEIALGDNIIRSVTIRSVGTAGYSASSATSTDAESRVAVSQQVIEIPTLSSLPDAPLTVAAGTAIGGNLAIVANPNGGGAGVPLSVWSREVVDIGASFASCGREEYDYTGNSGCKTAAYSSNKNGKQADIVEDDKINFPPDSASLLAYIFAGSSTVEEVISDTIQSNPTDYEDRVGVNKTGLADCSSLNASSSGRYIINGNCAPSGTVGSKDHPVELLVVDGDLTLNANAIIYGLVFAFDTANSPDYPSTATYDMKINGTASVYGVVVSNYKLKISNGGFNAVYDPDVLTNLSNKSKRIVAIVPGSWRDWE